MKAIVQDRFGPPEVLRLADTDLPEAGADDVLARVRAAALNPADWHTLRGDPLVARLMGAGLTRPEARVAGVDAAGVAEAAGANVRGLRTGDEVLGFCRGAFAEYACAAADLVVSTPAGLTFEQAAAVPIAATTALRGIRDAGEVTAGQRVLINGAGGGVGTYAVQIAAEPGAEVTGVCSTRNAGLVRSIGAVHVIDYATQDFTGGPTRYDVILDNVSSLPLSRLRRALTPNGTLVLNGGGPPGHVSGPVAGILPAVAANAFVPQRLRPLPSRQDRAELLAVTGLIKDGKLIPVIDRTCPWPRRPGACAPWSRATRAARSSSPSRETGRRGRRHHRDPARVPAERPHPGHPPRGEQLAAAGRRSPTAKPGRPARPEQVACPAALRQPPRCETPSSRHDRHRAAETATRVTAQITLLGAGPADSRQTEASAHNGAFTLRSRSVTVSRPPTSGHRHVRLAALVGCAVDHCHIVTILTPRSESAGKPRAASFRLPSPTPRTRCCAGCAVHRTNTRWRSWRRAQRPLRRR